MGADIIAFKLTTHFLDGLEHFHQTFVLGDRACFLVDDLWIAMYLRLCGMTVVSLRDLVLKRGLETIYERTDNANVVALESLRGDDRRDLVMLRAFDGLLGRLTAVSSESLQLWGGIAAAMRMKELAMDVHA